MKDKITQIINQVSNRTISTDEAIEEMFHLFNAMHSFSIEDLRRAFEDAKKGGIVETPVVIDQYGSVNIEQHFVANLYPTFDDWYDKKRPSQELIDVVNEQTKIASSKPVCDVKNLLLSPRQVDDKFTEEWAKKHIWEYEKCSSSLILAWGYRLGYEEARKHINYGKENI